MNVLEKINKRIEHCKKHKNIYYSSDPIMGESLTTAYVDGLIFAMDLLQSEDSADSIMCKCWAAPCEECPEWGANGECMMKCG